MEFPNDKGHQITARKLMQIMLYDNGAVNRIEPETQKRYPKKHFDRITKACEIYFEVHPELLTDENLDEIAAGEQEENKIKFGCYLEYEELNEALNEYFDIM